MSGIFQSISNFFSGGMIIVTVAVLFMVFLSFAANPRSIKQWFKSITSKVIDKSKIEKTDGSDVHSRENSDF